ncbi:uncharacterized protein LOC135128089 isoform X2 [Zophobas morio]|uniref:uncharacterized protein LOC135128089 isoform X2 n=1 Tax=Zophobas morio TaxID=2755281 RepID=UPI003082ACEE
MQIADQKTCNCSVVGTDSMARGDRNLKKNPRLSVRRKIECRNHLLRNFCNHLKELTTRRVSSTRQIVTPDQRLLLKNNIRRFRSAIQSAVKYRCSESGSHEEKVASLRTDILNSIYHIFGDHSKCATYFCKDKDSANNYIPDMTRTGLLQDIRIVLNRIVQHADSLLLDMDNNSAECYNSVVAKFIGGKRINLAGRDSFQLRCQAAGISFNTGHYKYPHLIYKSITKRSPGKFVKSYMAQKKRIHENKLTRRQLFPEKYKKKIKLPAETDADYGPDAAAISNILPDSYEIEKKAFLDALQKTPLEINELQQKTIGQSNNRTWVEERYKRLTASVFGKICKMRHSTSCQATVKSLLYSTFSGSTATDWGKTHEPMAVEAFQIANDVTVEPCGLFIDANFGFLAASPDGLIGNNAIIEIKCPYSAAQMTPIDAILQKKLAYCTSNNGKIQLKKSSDYYFQIQGQLHITRRDICHFVIWTPLGIEVERISRDDVFWSQKMEYRLEQFYYNCLLPELLYPQHPKNLPIRDLRKREPQKTT